MLADGELRGVDSNGDPPSACVQVVAAQSPLVSLIQRAPRRQGQRMRGNDLSRQQVAANVHRNSHRQRARSLRFDDRTLEVPPPFLKVRRLPEQRTLVPDPLRHPHQ